MNHTFHLLVLLLLLHRLSRTSTATDAPITPHSTACSDELVAFSSCLPYVAISPNNLTDSPPPQCCDDVSTAFQNGSAICLCYFVLRPKILGFPLEATKVLSLTSVCPLKDQNSKPNFSLGTLCSGSAVLPPLKSITGPSISMPLEGVHSPPPPLMGSAQESSGSSSIEEPADELPSQPGVTTIPTTISASTERKCILFWNLLIFPVYVLASVLVACPGMPFSLQF